MTTPVPRVAHREVRESGARTVHLSICQEDFSPAVRLILGEVGRAIRRCEP